MPANKRRRRKPATKKNARSGSRARSKPRHGFLRKWVIRLALMAVLVLVGYAIYLDFTVRQSFAGSRWTIPAHVYSRPLELFAGRRLGRDDLIQELRQLGYRNLANPVSAGSYVKISGGVRIHLRNFASSTGYSGSALVDVYIDNGTVTRLADADGNGLGGVHLEPRLMGSISPVHHEDRILVQRKDIPDHLINALLSIEDRNYYQHFGVDPRGLARALWANLVAGEVVQGGSTLTQQLAKNLYLSREKTLQRKLTEMIIAVLLEAHYDKDEILEAYINEVFLGQSGNRAVHGFGLASQFYFGRPLGELKLQELALLAAMVKGASFYNPFRSPERAKVRRNLVLDKMVEYGYLDRTAASNAKKSALGVTRQGALSATDYPAFLDFVRLQLRRDYDESDLRTEGLHIVTSLDPLIQKSVEESIKRRLPELERARGLPTGTLQAAVLVVRSDNGEVAALAGGKRAGYAGFNRALEAERPIGSLIKPVVFLAAFEQGYSLASILDDSPLTVAQRGLPDWKPKKLRWKVTWFSAPDRCIELFI